MTHTTSEDKKNFIISILTRVLFFYVLFSLGRFYIYNEWILSKNLIVIVMAIVMAVLSVLYFWLKSLFNIDRSQRKYRYYLIPISHVIVTYLFISFVRYAIWQDSILTNNEEIITFSVMIGIIEALGRKIDDVSPRNPKKEPDKPLKYYTDKFITQAKPFHKLMFFVYGFCVLLIVFILVFIF